MALLTESNGLVTDATRIASFKGQIELVIRRFGTDSPLVIDSDKLVGGAFSLPAASTTETGSYRGFKLVGSSTAITAPAGTGDVNLFIGGIFNPAAATTYTIDAGVGKVEILGGDTLNVKNAETIVGLALTGADFALEPRSVLFVRQTGTAASKLFEGGTALTNNTVLGGTGTAILTNTASGSTFSTEVDLDVINYPFGIATADDASLSPIGSSIIFHS